MSTTRAKPFLSGPQQARVEERIMGGTRFLGVPAFKNPMDAWVYQEIIHELRPDVIVEVGNAHGGALLYLACICDTVGHGEVVGVDVTRSRMQASHDRISLITGDAIDVFPDVAALVAGRSALVIEDSAHTFDHTIAVLRTYSALIQVGGYMVCEDGLMPAVAEALRVFAAEQRRFVADPAREWPATWNPGGYLRRAR